MRTRTKHRKRKKYLAKTNDDSLQYTIYKSHH